MRCRMLLLAFSIALAGSPALAASDDAAERLFIAASVAERDAALTELDGAAAKEPLAAYAAGTGHFFLALEKLGQGLHRHGFESPRSFMLPLMQLPVPDNASPQSLDYQAFRAILADFRTEMARAATLLSAVPASADIGIVVDLGKLGIDLDENGQIAPTETAGAIIAALQPRGSDAQFPASLMFRFDRADGYWLQGYANFLMAQADFWLAHDFHVSFEQSFQMLFPRAGLPLQEVLVPKTEGGDSILTSEWRFADLITFIHDINWPVVEPNRRRDARRELLEMIRLSREDWKAIRAETDNDREWLPGPQQKGANLLTGLEVTEDQVAAWHQALDLAEDLLEGRSLLPHFRIDDKGIDMKRFFDDPRTFDLVTMLTGPGAVPYLGNGRLITSEEFNRIQSQFGGSGFMTYAFWFN